MCSKFISRIHNNIKFYKQAVSIKRKYGTSCLMLGISVKLTCDSKLKIQEPDISKLSREYFIKSSSIITTENALILHTQAALALQQAEIEYKEALLALVFLLEFKLTVLGNQQEEARIWDLILEGRSLVNNAKKKRDDLETLFSRTQSLVSIAAEVTFMTGADVVGSSSGDRLNKLEQVIREEKGKSEQAEKKLQETEVKVISIEGKYAEEHAEELEEERQRLIQDLGETSKHKTDGTQNTESEKNSEDVDVIDILGTVDETLKDDAATEI